MTYKNYSARVTFDAENELLHGEVLGMRDVITFQAPSIDALKREFRASVDEYLAWCEELGQEPDRAYSGKYLVRMTPELHRNVALAAEREGTSINAFVVSCLEARVRSARADAPVRPAATRER